MRLVNAINMIPGIYILTYTYTLGNVNVFSCPGEAARQLYAIKCDARAAIEFYYFRRRRRRRVRVEKRRNDDDDDDEQSI